jgi:tripartite-type tricarboxylate transporter receptor subunit TctC
MTRLAQGLLVSLMLSAGVTVAAAADFPSKPVHLIVPFPPGGTIDVVTRLTGAKLRENWRQPIIIENRVGANGAIAVDYVAKSTPDGHTLLFHSSLMVATQQLQRTSYDVNRDLVAVVQTATINFAAAASPKSGVTTLDELIELAKKNPGRLNYSSGGNGSGTHLYAELLKRAAKINLTHVPYKGDAPAVQAVVSGEVDLLFTTTGNLMPHVKSGKVRPLLVTGAKPLEGLPNVPAMDVVYPGVSIDATYVRRYCRPICRAASAKWVSSRLDFPRSARPPSCAAISSAGARSFARTIFAQIEAIACGSLH